MLFIKIIIGIIVAYFIIGGISACMLSSKISQDEESKKVYDFIKKNIDNIKGEKDGTN